MPELPVSAAAVLGWVGRAHAYASKSYAGAADDWLVANRAPDLARRIFRKAAIAASDSSMAPAGISIGAWSDSARTTSAFYRILADGAFVRLPLRNKVGLITSAASAGVRAEGKGIAVSKVVIGNVSLVPTEVNGLIVCTNELLFALGAESSVFNRELLSVISAAVDTAFLDKIDTGLTPITSTAALADVRAALLAVTGGEMARPYFIAAPDVGKLASTLSDTKGGPAFAAASMVGGELANLPLLISSGCPAGYLYLLDAAQIAANAEAPTIDVSTSADIQMDTAPTIASDVPTAGQMVSLFQTDSVALKSVAVFACEKLRSTAVAVVTGISATTWAP